MAQVNTSGGTSFSELKSAYVAGGLTDASGDASLKDGSTAIDLSYFRNAKFTDGTSVPGSGEIRIGTRFINSGTGRTFGSGTVALTSVSITGENNPFTTMGNPYTYTAVPNSGATGVTYTWEWDDSGEQQGIPASSTGGIVDGDTITPDITFTVGLGTTSVLKVTASQSGASDVTGTLSLFVF